MNTIKKPITKKTKAKPTTKTPIAERAETIIRTRSSKVASETFSSPHKKTILQKSAITRFTNIITKAIVDLFAEHCAEETKKVASQPSTKAQLNKANEQKTIVSKEPTQVLKKSATYKKGTSKPVAKAATKPAAKIAAKPAAKATTKPAARAAAKPAAKAAAKPAAKAAAKPVAKAAAKPATRIGGGTGSTGPGKPSSKKA